jgi:glycosyltransferase involved in cell wall biosynthesis
MKLALVTNSFPTTSETFIYNQAAGLQAAGIDVTVIAARPSTDHRMFEDFDGLRYTGPVRHAILAENAALTAKRFAQHLIGASVRDLTLWREARRAYGNTKRAARAWLLALPFADFDLVHFAYSGLAVAWADALPLLAPSAVIVSCRGTAERVTPLVEPNRAEALRRVFALADRVHCVTEDMRATCAAYGLDPTKAFVNHPSINLGRFQRRVPYPARSSGPYRILSTGRLHWAKGYEFGLMAIRTLVDQRYDVHYEIVGSGPDEGHLRYTVAELGLKERVTFRGKRSSKQVRDALEHCDLYMLPSVSEGISNAALEAMAMEVPVVTTSAGGMLEAVTNRVEGLVVPPREPAALAEAIAALLGNRELRIELGRTARHRIERDFSLGRQIDSFVLEYRSVLSGSGTKKIPKHVNAHTPTEQP